MKKVSKFLTLVLTLVVCLSPIQNVSASEKYLDTHNNNLFSIVKEITLHESYYGALPSTMKDYSSKASEDGKKVKIIRYGYDNTGTYSETAITEYLSPDDYYKKMKEYISPTTYNDGLIMDQRVDEEWGGFTIYSYTDINNNTLYEGIREQGSDFGYNIGLLRESYSPMNMETGRYEGGHTTFTKIMSTNSSYTFKADFTDFNDDGYAIMQENGKFYLVKLRSGVIPTVFYNGKKIKFDQIPVIENGRTLVPLRAIFETLGAKVSWDEKTNTVTATKSDTTVKLTVGKKTAYKNGKEIPLDVAAKIVGGRTLVPARFVADCFGVDVEWEAPKLQVILTKK